MNINVIALAYLGDSVYELFIRDFLIKKGIYQVENLQKESLNYVSAKSQARILKSLIEKNILTEEEIDLVKRGRNNNRGYHPKNTDIITYKLATGLETLFGQLYLDNKIERIKELMSFVEKM